MFLRNTFFRTVNNTLTRIWLTVYLLEITVTYYISLKLSNILIV